MHRIHSQFSAALVILLFSYLSAAILAKETECIHPSPAGCGAQKANFSQIWALTLVRSTCEFLTLRGMIIGSVG